VKTPVPPTPEEIERLCQLATVGAGLAATALGQLLESHVHARAPRVCDVDAAVDPDEWCTGILFEAEEDLTGFVAIVMPEVARDRAAELMIGIADPAVELAESALRELGNILASQTVSAIADTLDATILLSVPTLALRDAGMVLRSLICQRGAQLRIETELCAPDGSLVALLVFAPDPEKASDSPA